MATVVTINSADLTSNVQTNDGKVIGDGVFDNLMETITAHLEAQFNAGRLTGSNYATVYLGAMQTAMQSAAQFVLSKQKADAEVALLEQKVITEYAQTMQVTKVAPDTASVLGKQINLYTEQAKGFKWNADQKYLKTLLDAWAINTSTAGAADTSISEIIGATLNTTIQNTEPS